MERNKAVLTQRGLNSKEIFRLPEFRWFAVGWMIMSILAGLVAALVEFVTEIPVTREAFEYSHTDEEGKIMKVRSLLTGSQGYMNYVLVWPILLKVFVAYSMYRKTQVFYRYKYTFYQNFYAVIAFYVTYAGFGVIYKMTGGALRISGHFLALIYASSMLVIDGSYYEFYIKTEQIFPWVVRGLILYNFYIVFWTGLVYHTFLECILATIVGLSTNYLIYFR